MSENAKLEVNGQTVELPVTVGTENEVAVDISKLRPQTGVITLDNGFANTGSCSLVSRVPQRWTTVPGRTL